MSVLLAPLAILVCARAAATDVFRLYVAPHGSDEQPGTTERPFRTPTAARDALRQARAQGLVQGRAEVVLESGTYPPLSLGPKDSGASIEAPVAFIAAPGPSPTVISGGVPVPAETWKESDTPGVLVAQIPSVPGTKDLGGLEANEGIHECANDKTELVFREKRMVLARYPNIRADGFWNFSHASEWVNATCFSIPDSADPETAARIATWTAEADGWVHGYWHAGYSDGYRKIASITSKHDGWSLEIEGSGYTQPDWSSIQLPGSPDDNFTVTAENSTLADGCQRLFHIGTSWWLRQNGKLVHRLSCNNQKINIKSKTYNAGGTDVCLQNTTKGNGGRNGARFYGVNLLSELDAPGEYFIDREQRRLYFYPPVPLAGWGDDVPVLTVSDVALDVSNSENITLEGMTVLHSRGVGINAVNVTGVVIRNCTVAGHGLDGVVLVGINSSVLDSVIHDTGCGGVRAHGGTALTLTPGNLLVSGNTVSYHGLWKRAYMPAIHWGGVANTYSHNTVSWGPHNCFLGGGNEVRDRVPGAQVATVDNIFEYNTIDTCAFETSDVGAFYTCGQSGTAWVNRGNKLRHSVFRNIRPQGGASCESCLIMAVYLDDMISDWEVYNNSFIDCHRATWAGGGRRNIFHSNHYWGVHLAHHFDNRGMGGQKQSCECSVNATAPFETSCNPAAVAYVLAGPAGAQWAARWPELTNLSDACMPVQNVFRDNTCHKCRFFTDVSPETFADWKSIYENNTVDMELVGYKPTFV